MAWVSFLNAAESGDVSSMEALLLASDDVQKLLDFRLGEEKRTALHQASRHGHKHVVELLLKAGVSIGQEDAKGETALSLAAQNNQQSIVEILLEHGANINARAKPRNLMAISYAASSGHLNLVCTLLADGADVLVHKGALIFAAGQGHIEVVEQLLARGSQLDLTSQSGRCLRDAIEKQVVRRFAVENPSIVTHLWTLLDAV